MSLHHGDTEAILQRKEKTMITVSTPAATITISPDVERAHEAWEQALKASRDADHKFWTTLDWRKAQYDAIGKYHNMPRRIQNAEHETREKWFEKQLRTELGSEIAKLYLERKAAQKANSLACSQFYPYFPDHNSDSFQRELAAFVLQQLM
jgi:hypothetical protein